MIMALMLWSVTAVAPGQATILTFDLGNPLAINVPPTYGDNAASSTNGSFSSGMGNGFTSNVTVDYATPGILTGGVTTNSLG